MFVRRQPVSSVGDEHLGDVAVTTIHAAAARRSIPVRACLALALVSALGLTGCETSNSLFGSNSGSTQPENSTTASTSILPAAPAPAATRISVAPVIGAPEGVARQLQQDFTAAVGRQRVQVAAPGDTQVEYTLRGYIVAAKEKTSTKVSYIWDVTDPSGKRVNRITGEEIVAGSAAKDPWTSVTPAMTQAIAEKSATSFGAWLPGQSNQAGIATPASATSATPLPIQAAAAPAAALPVQQAVARPQGPTTASIVSGRDSVSAIVPSVVGAPGDGSQSLTTAIQRELTKNGVALSDAAGATAYRVEGKVQLGQGADGKQSVQIDWLVRDPAGKRLGTVSQKNEIPQGSLDGAWGQTADAAAAAAAQGIIKLLPSGGRSTN